MTFIRRIRREFPTWERSTQAAFGSALALLIVALIAAAFAPVETRPLILIGALGLLIVAQAAVMWGNRGMVTPYTLAQRAYLGNDFARAREILETERAVGKADARSLTLLGNTYRQLGDLIESEQILSQAVDNAPEDQFPRYGFGRTLLAQGRYAEAAAQFERALATGAPAVTRMDWGEALLRAGRDDQAGRVLMETPENGEAYRGLMKAHLLYTLGLEAIPHPALARGGIAYWQASAERFAHTPYGEALVGDVKAMQQYAETGE